MKNSMKMNIGIIASIFLFIIIPFAAGYDTDSKNLGNGASIVFVDINNPSCSDSYTRAQALDGATPWCTLDAPLTNDKIQSGDTLYIAKGEYNGESDISGRTITKNITISAYPGDTVNVTRYFGTRTGGPANGNNNLWTKVGEGLWYTNAITDYDASTPHAIVYYENETHMVSFDSYSSLSTCTYSTGCSWYDNSNKRLYIKLSNSLNPNNIKLFVASNNYPLMINKVTANNGVYLIIKDLSFHYFKFGIQLYDSSHVIIRNNKFYGGHSDVYIRGTDGSSAHDVTVENNYFWGGVPPGLTVEDMKASGEETAPIWSEDFSGNIIIRYNRFNNTQGGILLYNDNPTEGDGSEIYSNSFVNSWGSLLEIEKYAYNVKYHDNNITDCNYAGVSFAPANCAASPTPCEFYNNIIVCNGKHNEGGGVQEAWAIKAENRAAPASITSNWKITHNTFVGKQRALNGMNANIFYNTKWTDNIFYSGGDYTLTYTSLATRGVFFDYNLYYIEPTGAVQLFRRWNNDGTSGYTSLAAALASQDWDGTWDINSVQANPLFTNLAGNNVKPQSGSPACTMSTTGNYVGAIPCTGINPAPNNTPPTQGTPTILASDNPNNTTDATLYCYNTSTVDANGDTVTNIYRWYRNNSLRSGLTSSSLTSSNTAVGDIWKCEITPYDGKTYGLTRNSTTIIIRPTTKTNIAGLKGSWNLSTNYIDSINKNTAIPIGNIIFVNDPTYGKVVSFNNSKSYLVVNYTNNTLTPQSGFTMDVKVKFDSVKHSYIIRDGESYLVQQYVVGTKSFIQAGVFSNNVWNPILNSATELQTSKWYRVTYTYDIKSGLFKLYLDKKLNAQKTWTGKVDMSSQSQLFIGNRKQLDRWLDGSIHDLRIYNKALSDTEVLNLP